MSVHGAERLVCPWNETSLEDKGPRPGRCPTASVVRLASTGAAGRRVLGPEEPAQAPCCKLGLHQHHNLPRVLPVPVSPQHVGVRDGGRGHRPSAHTLPWFPVIDRPPTSQA